VVDVERMSDVPVKRRIRRLHHDLKNGERDAARRIDDSLSALIPPAGKQRRTDAVERSGTFRLLGDTKKTHLAENTVPNAPEHILDLARRDFRFEFIERASTVERRDSATSFSPWQPHASPERLPPSRTAEQHVRAGSDSSRSNFPPRLASRRCTVRNGISAPWARGRAFSGPRTRQATQTFHQEPTIDEHPQSLSGKRLLRGLRPKDRNRTFFDGGHSFSIAIGLSEAT
jgi:hypothetical protein